MLIGRLIACGKKCLFECRAFLVCPSCWKKNQKCPPPPPDPLKDPALLFSHLVRKCSGITSKHFCWTHAQLFGHLFRPRKLSQAQEIARCLICDLLLLHHDAVYVLVQFSPAPDRSDCLATGTTLRVGLCGHGTVSF